MITDERPHTSETPELEKHTAPAVSAGFLFQFRRAIKLLAEAPNGTTLGVETLDDLAIERSNGKTILEQDKFTSKQSGTVFGDKTSNLLGTLSTWLAALLSGEISLETTSFLLVTNDVCRDGLVRRISNADSDEAAQNCLQEILQMRSSSKARQRLLTLIEKPRGTDLFLRLCLSVQLSDGEESTLGSARRALPIPSFLEDKRDSIFDSLYGWIQSQALETWEAGKPCRISKQAFTNQLFAILGELKRTKQRERPVDELPVADEEIAREREATYVRQVGLVTEDEAYKTDAICDYIRCFTEKTRLSKEGEIAEKDWRDFSDRLQRRWSDIWSKNKRLWKDAEEDIGFRTMIEVLGDDFHPLLAGEPTTQVYLANGTYHRLSDKQTIGWHPRYRELLAEGDSHGHPV